MVVVVEAVVVVAAAVVVVLRFDGVFNSLAYPFFNKRTCEFKIILNMRRGSASELLFLQSTRIPTIHGSSLLS